MQFMINGQVYETTEAAQEAAAATIEYDDWEIKRQERLDHAETLAETMEILNEPWPAELREEVKADQLGRAYFNVCQVDGRKLKGCVFVDSNPHWGGKFIGVSYDALDGSEPKSHWFIVADGDCLSRSYAEMFRRAGLDIYDTVKVI